MTATIQTKSNRYYIVVNWRRDGERKQKWVRTDYLVGDNCKRKLEQLRIKTLQEYDEKESLVDSDILFSDFLVQWLEDIKHSIELSTYHSYRQAVCNSIAPYFAERKIKLSELKPIHIQRFYNSKLDDGLTGNTVLHLHANIHKALDYAVKTERLSRNPSNNLDLPKKEKHIANYYSAEELNILLDKAKGTPIETVVNLAAWFGLRRGEIIGLRWGCIDFDAKTLSVVGVMRDKSEPGKGRQMYYVPHTKTLSSIRSFPMPDEAVKYLSALKHEQDELKARYKHYNHKWDDFVCVRQNGDIIPLEFVPRAFPALCEKSGLRRLRLHELRHTNISVLLEAGASMKELQEWAGHSTYGTTANIYAHIQTKSKVKLTEMLNSIIAK